MLEQLQYINHLNENLDFGKNHIFVNENDLHDFKWDILSKNDRIAAFKRGIAEKAIPIIIKSDTPEEGYNLRNKLYEICEKDVLALKHGRLIINGYYLKCFITESKKSNYLINKSYMKISAKITTDYPFWCKETSNTFNYGKGSVGKNLDYKRDFAFDFTSNLLGKQLDNGNIADSNFRIIIYGPFVNPSISIGGHVYSVNVSAESNEYLTIDAQAKTVILTRKNGAKENCFNKRNKDSYIFQKIPPGSLNISADSNFKFEVVLLEERSEPKWI